ncbi:MAG: hypothetical protein EXR98_02170 [Gemmataceae bacterium]|nr:hypothetical protein [Gemmataceae bacterium]
MRPWLIGIPLLVFGFPAQTQADSVAAEATLDKAQAAFRQGVENKPRLLQARKHFSEATDGYWQLHEQGYRIAALYRSLGNAAVLADRWPEAIWAYQCGLKLDPNDRSMREHLAFVRAKVLYSPSGLGRPDAEFWPIWLYRPGLFAWACIGFFFYIALCIGGTLAFAARATLEGHYWQTAETVLIIAGLFLGGWIVISRPGGRRFVIAGALVAALVLVGIGSWQELRQAQGDHAVPLVVLAANADFHRGNGPSYPKHPVLPVLPRGLEARQMHRRGEWLQIRLTTGETGWVHASQALIVGS